MENKKRDDAAFAAGFDNNPNHYFQDGLTKREYMATHIFAAMLGGSLSIPRETNLPLPEIAVTMADELIKELEQRDGN